MYLITDLQDCECKIQSQLIMLCVIYVPTYFLRLIEGPAKTLLVIISLAGFVTFDVVYVAAVVNYAAQSEMNIKLLYAIQAMVEQKLYPDIDSSIKVCAAVF